MAGRGRGRGQVPLNPPDGIGAGTPDSGQLQSTDHEPAQPTQPVSSVTEGIGRVVVGRGRGRGTPVAMPGLSSSDLDPFAGRAASMMPQSMGGAIKRPPCPSQVAYPASAASSAVQGNLTPTQSLPPVGRGRGRGANVAAGVLLEPPGMPPTVVTTASLLTTASTVVASAAITSSGTASTGVTSAQPGPSSASASAQPPPPPELAQAVGPQALPAAPAVVVVAPAAAEQAPEVQSFRGDKGDKVRTMANFVKINVAKDYILYEYHTTFVPHFEETRVRKMIINTLSTDIGCRAWSFDGRKLYLPVQLDDSKRAFTTMHPHEPSKSVTVTMTLVRITDDTMVQHYNVLMRKIMTALNFTEISRDYYNPAKVTDMPAHNLEIWSGYITAIEVYEGGLMMCLNSTSRVMRKDTVLDLLKHLMQQNPNGYKKAFEDAIINNAVLTRYNNKHYKIRDVNWTQNPLSTFERRGVPITFKEYYMSQHGRDIQNMTQPILISRVKARKNDPRGEAYFISLIPELCNQSGLTDDMRGNFGLMKDLIAHSRSTPIQRHNAILEFVTSIYACEKAVEIMDSWGLGFERSCLIDVARQLPGPTLQFNTLTLKVAPADFTREATSNKCYSPIALKNFQVYCTGQDREKAEKMITQYKQVSPALGILFGPHPELIILSNRTGRGMPTAVDIRQALRTNVTSERQVQFIVVILPMAKDDLYAAVKRFCLTERSTPSQVILQKTLSQDKKLRPVMQKVALQINCKLGGSLWALNIPLKDLIMFVGIDAHHDPSQKKKSVLALVASLDNHCTKYYSRIVNQGTHQESGDAIRPVFIQALQAFYTENERYPDRIVVFRDGVGDGMLETVRLNEVAEIKKVAEAACSTQPKLLFVVVQKRINERLFLIKPARQLDNPLPGTVMDHTITRRGMYDFFLISQLVRQGTVGPSHFVVLEDSGENKPDLVQRFAYVTSYMYYNWPGTVRVPAMCQYAHKLAMLAGQHLESEPLDTMERQLYYL